MNNSVYWKRKNEMKDIAIQLKIYKKKLVLKKAGALSGTYKLKKRYQRP